MSDNRLVTHRAQLRSLPTPGGRMAYLDLGPRDGRPVVLVHGMPSSSYLYRRVAARLAEAGLRAIAPDLIGFGASDKPRDAHLYSLERQSARLIALLDHIGVDHATFVAHDLGGPWTFEIADRQPGRLEALVVLNTSAYAELMTPPREARLVGGPAGPARLRLMASRPGRRMVGSFFAQFTHAGRQLDPEVVTAHWTPLHEGGTRAFRSFARGLDASMAEFSRYAAALRKLDIPATVIWGVEDPVLRHELIVPRFVADLGIAEVDVHLLDAASHFLQEDRPDDVADLIAAFATRVVVRP